MATIPGTKYAQGAPSESTGQVLMNPPSEGGGQQVAAGLEKMGAAIIAYAFDVKQKKIDAEISQKKREIDEAGWATLESLIGDEETDKKQIENFEAKAEAITQSSEYKDVNSSLRKYYNGIIPGWRHGFIKESWSIQGKNAETQSLYEADNLLSMGKVNEAIDIYKKLKQRPFSKEDIAKYDILISEAPVKSHLLVAERLYMDKKYNLALGELKKVDESSLDNKILKQKYNLMVDLNKIKNEELKQNQIDQINNKLYITKDLEDIHDFIETLDAIPPEERTLWHERAARWANTLSGGGAVETSLTHKNQMEYLLNEIMVNGMPIDEAIPEFTLFSDEVEKNDRDNFITRAWAAQRTYQSDELRTRATILNERKDQLRDAIESQKTLLVYEESQEILKDLANKAVIELSDKFRDNISNPESKFDRSEIDKSVDELLRRYTPTPLQLSRMVRTNQLEQAKNLKEQQKALKDLIATLEKEGKRDEAKRVLDEAIKAGIFDSNGKAVEGTEKKNTSALKRIWQAAK